MIIIFDYIPLSVWYVYYTFRVYGDALLFSVQKIFIDDTENKEIQEKFYSFPYYVDMQWNNFSKYNADCKI